MEAEFLIKSEVLESLKADILKAAKLIRKHVDDKHPILIRHHDDADGFCGGVALEQAILPILYDVHSRERDAWYSYSRKPSITPYYAYEDANKDLAYFLSDRGKYEYKKPLVIVVDNGSSEEDLLALKKLRIYGVKVIVIDHHPLHKEVEEYTEVLVNPHKAGSNYDFSAGMLCAEIAGIIKPKILRPAFIAAVSAYADKVKSKEQEEYHKLAQKEGYTDEFIRTTAEVLDFEGGCIPFIDSRQLMDDFFGGKDREKQKKIIALLKTEVEKKRAESFLSAEKYSHVSRTPKMNIVIVPVGQISFRGGYPHAGKIVGMMHDHIAKTEGKPTVSLGFFESMIIFRGTPDTAIDVNAIIKAARHKFPYARIEGGGHAKAGAIKFVPAAFEEVKEFVLSEIRK